MNTLYHQTRPTLRSSIGNFQILQLALKHAVVEFSIDIQFAIKFLMELLKINIVGQMHKIKNQRKLEGLVIMRNVLRTGGLDLGSHVLLRVIEVVRILYFLQYLRKNPKSFN